MVEKERHVSGHALDKLDQLNLRDLQCTARFGRRRWHSSYSPGGGNGVTSPTHPISHYSLDKQECAPNYVEMRNAHGSEDEENGRLRKGPRKPKDQEEM